MNIVQVYDKRGKLVDCDDGIVPDGCGVRVPIFLMDSMQRDVAANLQVVDAWGAEAGHRPGYVFNGPNKSTEARDAAYDDSVKRLNDAWRNPSVDTPPPVSVTESADYQGYKDQLSNAWKTTNWQNAK
jgi:hypothetical protein